MGAGNGQARRAIAGRGLDLRRRLFGGFGFLRHVWRPGAGEEGVIYVAISYRVGVFGYLAHPDLTKESGHNASGSWGMLDQIAALKWVQRNIAAFGGDAANVTLMGQSAGAMSINDMNVSPMAHGLFAKLIGLSGVSSLRVGNPMTP